MNINLHDEQQGAWIWLKVLVERFSRRYNLLKLPSGECWKPFKASWQGNMTKVLHKGQLAHISNQGSVSTGKLAYYFPAEQTPKNK